MKKPRSLAVLLSAALALTAGACGDSDKKDKNGARPVTQAEATASIDPNVKVTISVGCQPPKTATAFRKDWDDDVASFQKLHPNITIQSKDAFPCINPATFQAKLASGKMETAYYVYYTDVQNIVAKKQAADITPYVSNLKSTRSVNPMYLKAFQGEDGKTYGLPRKAYTTGLVYNKALFSQAGLDASKPPTTWAEVQTAAKAIAGLGAGYIGYGEYSAGNTGGWHFTSELYGRGGDVVAPDGKKAAFNSPQGVAVLDNLKKMRWQDNSMGTKQLYQWEDLMRLLGSGKLGMMVGAPDVAVEAFNNFQAKVSDIGVTTLPESSAALLGGDGYMINPKASPDEIKAAIMWLEFHELTPGQGQFNYARQKANGRPTGQPENLLWGDNAVGAKDKQLRTQYANVPLENFAGYEQGAPKIQPKIEPPQAQAIYAILDTVMSAVLTRKDADPAKLLGDAEKKVNALLAKSPG